MYITYPNFPRVPEHLLLSSVEQLNSLRSPYPEEYIRNYGDVYTAYFCVNRDLADFLRSFLPFIQGDIVPYHSVGTKLPIHIDKPNRIRALNYIIDPGGPEVYTNFYTDDHTKLVHSEIIPTKTWHLFNSQIPHNTTGQQSFRFGLSISVPTDFRVI